MPPPPRVVPDADATPPAGLATTAWTVVFTPEGDGPGVIDRLSLTLKVALRRHGPRAVACGPVGTGAEARALDVLRRRARRREHREPAPGGKAELREWMERVRAGG